MKTSERRRKKKKGSTNSASPVFLVAPLVVFVFFFGIYVGSSGLFGHPGGQFTVGQHPLLQPQQQERQLVEENYEKHVPASSAPWNPMAQSSLLSGGGGSAAAMAAPLLRQRPPPHLQQPALLTPHNPSVPHADTATHMADVAVPHRDSSSLLRSPDLAAAPPPPPPPPPPPLPAASVTDANAAAAAAANSAPTTAWRSRRSRLEARPSFVLADDSYVRFRGSLDSARDLSVSLWLFVHEVRGAGGSTMMTILSNKAAGCDAGNVGFALFVNEWETSDRQLLLEYGGSGSGCHKLGSGPDHPVPFGRWVHIAASLPGGSDGGVSGGRGRPMELFLDGRLVASSSHAQEEGAIVAERGAQTSRQMHLGRYPGGQYAFTQRANISGLLFLDGALSSEAMAPATASVLDEATGGGAAAGRPPSSASTAAAAAEESRAEELVRALASATEDPQRGAARVLDLVPAAAAEDKEGKEAVGRAHPLLAARAYFPLTESATEGGRGGRRGGYVALNPAHRPKPAAAQNALLGDPRLLARRLRGAVAEASEEGEFVEPDRSSLAARLGERAGAFSSSGGGGRSSGGLPLPAATFALGPSELPEDAWEDGGGGGSSGSSSSSSSSLDDAAARAKKKSDDDFGRRNAKAVVRAMQHAWAGYKSHAWGRDELKPVSGRGNDPWGGIGCTLVDSLDTLWLMGLKDDFEDAKRWVRSSLSFDRAGRVSVFETTIRELGGLLAAFDASGDTVFLDKAEDLGRRLSRAFKGSPSGVPFGSVDISGAAGGGGGRGGGQNAGWTGNAAVLSELGTLQVDFRYLSEMTGDPSFATLANRAFDLMCSKSPPHGLYPIYVRTESGGFSTRQVTFGALGDSFYEYLLKVWVQGGRSEGTYRRVYDRAMDGMVEVLLQASHPSKLAYIADWDGSRLNHKMDHLVCFMGGSLALGAFTDPDGRASPRAVRDLEIARALTYTCYQMYERAATGIAPEWVQFRPGRDFAAGPGGAFNILRPEAIESIFIMHQLTGDPIYRVWGKKMFDALEKHCRTQIAYGGLGDVNSPGRRPDDRMESFFLAETLKYHFLLQQPLEDHGIDLLESHVFNTEAHPLSMFHTPRFEELKTIASKARGRRGRG